MIGNPNAPVQITMAASLGCGPCKLSFEQAVQIVENLPGYVNLAFRLYLAKYKKGDEINNPGGYILNVWQNQIYSKKNQSNGAIDIINDWYKSSSFESFKRRYPINKSEQKAISGIQNIVDLHADWFENEGINKTPTFFINGYSLPLNYRIEDVKHLILPLADQLLSGFQLEQKLKKQETIAFRQKTLPE